MNKKKLNRTIQIKYTKDYIKYVTMAVQGHWNM